MYASALSFDTHKYVKEFVNKGIPESHAEVFIKLVQESKDYDLSKLSTKEQVTLLEQKLIHSRQESKADTEFFKQEVRNDFERMEQKIENSRNEAKADIDRLDQKIESSIEKLNQKIEASRNESKADINRLEQKITHIEEKMATREDLSRIEVQIAKQDSQQKAWMIGIFLSIIAMTGTLLFKLN